MQRWFAVASGVTWRVSWRVSWLSGASVRAVFTADDAMLRADAAPEQLPTEGVLA